MAFMDKYDFENLKNDGEKLVFQELGRQLEALEVPGCLCNECILDMAAISLNSIKPLYQVSLLGSLYTSSTMDRSEYGESIKAAVANAIEKVMDNPNHDVRSEPEDDIE